jgi:hypothetical protein
MCIHEVLGTLLIILSLGLEYHHPLGIGYHHAYMKKKSKSCLDIKVEYQHTVMPLFFIPLQNMINLLLGIT